MTISWDGRGPRDSNGAVPAAIPECAGRAGHGPKLAPDRAPISARTVGSTSAAVGGCCHFVWPRLPSPEGQGGDVIATKGSAKQKGDAAARIAAEGAGASVEQIRDILFGAQMRDYEGRFAALESRVSADLAKLREETRSRLDGLEEHVRREIDRLGDRLASESREREETDGRIERQGREASDALGRRLSDLSDRAADDARALGERILERTKALEDAIGEAREGLTARVEGEAAALRDAKADRIDLAEMLTDMAARLSGSGRDVDEVPGPDGGGED